MKKHIICFLLLVNTFTFAQNIKVGISTAFSGPAKILGQEMYLGINTYFMKVNYQKKQHSFEIIALDDRYEPEFAAKNMRQLIDKNDILAILGNIGTPTANVTVPIANEKKILLFGAFTGAEVLRRNPPDRYIINYRASYEQETASMIDGLLKSGVKAEEIAFFTQEDSYGDDGYIGAIKALEKIGFKHTNELSHGRYTRNTLNIEDGLSILLDAKIEPKAIIIVGTYAPVAKFITMAKEDFPNALFLNVSFVGSNALKSKLKGNTKNIIVTQVVPNLNSELPIVKEYLEDLKEFSKNKNPSFVSLEGYIVGKLFVEAILRINDKKITKEKIINSFENIKVLNIGLGFSSGFSNNNHQYSNSVWPTILINNKYVGFKWSELKIK